jgi:hypothetical protein
MWVYQCPLLQSAEYEHESDSKVEQLQEEVSVWLSTNEMDSLGMKQEPVAVMNLVLN